MEVKSIEDVLNLINSGIVNNNYQDHYIVFMRMIYNFLIESKEVNSEYLFDILKQSSHILLKLFKVKNEELKVDYLKLRKLILNSLEDNQISERMLT